MRKQTPKTKDEDSVGKIVGGAIGVVIGAVLLWIFFSYGIAALFGG